jgi:transcriptional regulator with XRE-family HTH domain
MEFGKALGKAIRDIRVGEKITPDSMINFATPSYLSELENGELEVSVIKINALAGLIGVHPLTILTLGFINADGVDYGELQEIVQKELLHIGKLEL